MNPFRQKQKQFKRLTNTVVIVTAVLIAVLIGVQPYLSDQALLVGRTLSELLVLVSMVLLFYYISRYAKAERSLEDLEYAVSDAGYYLTAREEKTVIDYADAVKKDLQQQGFRISENVALNGDTFSARGYKGKEYFYIAADEQMALNSERLNAFLQSAIDDCTSVNMKRKGHGVVLLLCSKAEDSAIALSKEKIYLGRKNALQFSVAIAELSAGRVYCLGNQPSVSQKLIVNFVLNCDLPLKDAYIGKEKLPFQSDLEERLQHFDTKLFE